MRAIAHGVLLAIGAILCAAVCGVGVPLGWVWLASQLQSGTGAATGGLAALAVVVGPILTYIVLAWVTGWTRARWSDERPGRRAAWNRGLEADSSGASGTAFEQVLVLATFLVGVGFEVWFFLLAHQRPWGS